MNEISENEAAMPRSIRPSEAMKAWEVIEKSPGRVAAAKAAEWTAWTHTLGPFIRQRTDKAKREAGSTRGPTYSAELKKLLGDKLYPVFQKLSENGTLSYLMRILDNLEAVNAWRDRVPEEVRPTSPMRVWSGYEASLRSTIEIKDDDDEVGELVEEDRRVRDNQSRRPTSTVNFRDHIGEMFADLRVDLVNDLAERLQSGDTPDAFVQSVHGRLFGQGHSRAEIADMMINYGQALIAFGEHLKRVAEDPDRIEGREASQPQPSQ